MIGKVPSNLNSFIIVHLVIFVDFIYIFIYFELWMILTTKNKIFIYTYIKNLNT